MSGKVSELTSQNFEEFSKEGYVLIDFFAEWCGPCVMMGPVFESLAETFEGKVKFGKVNVGEFQDIAMKFNVSSIPNFVLLKEGKVVTQFIGAMQEDVFEEKIRETLE